MTTRSTLAAFICCAIAAGLAYTMTATPTTASPTQDGRENVSAVVRWEHLAMTHNSARVNEDAELSQQIIRLGDEGWEMVGVSTVTNAGTTEQTVFFFKRPK